jgi:uncharacterized membrane protein YfcA
MDFTLYWFMFPVGICVATVAMLSGIGGAALFTPIFVLIFPLLGPEYPLSTTIAAIGAALITQTFGFLSGFIAYYRRQLIDFPLAQRFIVMAAPMAIFGAVVAGQVADEILIGTYAGMVFVIAVFFVFHKKQKYERTSLSVSDKLITAFGAFLTGMVSVGIGEVIVSRLTRRGLPLSLAAATSVAVVIVTVAIASATLIAQMLQQGGITAMPWNLVCYSIPGVIVGGQIGPMLQGRFAQRKMELGIAVLFILIAFAMSSVALASESPTEETMHWPDGKRVAISLSYDDALASQLDNAVPALQEHNFKASFYLILSRPIVQERLTEWRALAASGHELGNHTIFHACRGSQPGRDWVDPDYDLDKRSLRQMHDEVITANAILHMIDGQHERTFTPPCADQLADGENYVDAVVSLFVGTKTRDKGMANGSSYLYMPFEASGKELIRYVKEHTRDGVLLNILFHGIGGDYISVSTQAHRELLQFLSDNNETYHVDTYINIMTWVREQNTN